MAVGILTQFKKGQVEVKLGTGFFQKNPGTANKKVSCIY